MRHPVGCFGIHKNYFMYVFYAAVQFYVFGKYMELLISLWSLNLASLWFQSLQLDHKIRRFVMTNETKLVFVTKTKKTNKDNLSFFGLNKRSK